MPDSVKSCRDGAAAAGDSGELVAHAADFQRVHGELGGHHWRRRNAGQHRRLDRSDGGEYCHRAAASPSSWQILCVSSHLLFNCFLLLNPLLISRT